MAIRSNHPARGDEEYRNKRLPKGRQLTFEQVKERQKLKKLKKKRRS